MTTQIKSKIVGFNVVTKEQQAEAPVLAAVPTVKQVSSFEDMKRPDLLRGTTYKLKTPVTEAAMYITINDAIIDEDLATEHSRPFEIFINSKNMEHYQWMVALTRVISAVFRKGGDITFLVEELRSVFDPKGGYFKKGGKYVPSLVAELGDILEKHLISIGMIIAEDSGEAGRAALAAKEEASAPTLKVVANQESDSAFPGAVPCPKCQAKAAKNDGGCLVCTACSFSKCN